MRLPERSAVSPKSTVTRTTRPPELFVDDVTLEYGGTRVLDSVSLSIAKREFVSIVGTSGCGKTTLLNVIAGFLAPTRGHVMHRAERVTSPGPERAMVFQEDAVFPWYSVGRNVGYALRIAGLDSAAVANRVHELLGMVGLADRADAWPRELSGGQRKRVDLARALAAEPDVLLMDEPFAALDEMTKGRLQMELLKFVDWLGVTVLFVTHDLEEAVVLSDRIVVMGAVPGGIVSEVTVPFSRPRSSELRTSEDAQALRRKIHGLLESRT